jgi:5-methyltetrahydrofolate--homocysteine methyltransferase
MKSIVAELKKGKVLVSDGAWGTFLQAKGLQPGECPEMWNVTHADEVLDIALSYIKAGSDMIETNSFGGNSFKLKNFNLQDKAYEINRKASEISRKAASANAFVIGSIGPTGKMLITGEVTEEELYKSFAEQCKGLYDGGADAVVIETFTDLDEARIAIKAAKDNTPCEVICTMTFDKTVDGRYMTMMGVSPTDMAKLLPAFGADIIGANCSNGIQGMIEIVKEIRQTNTTIPVLIHANAGMPVYDNGKTVFPESPEIMGGFVKALVQAGTNIVGGCCGTTPDHIREIGRIVRSA